MANGAMTDEQLAEIEARAAAASPGPWTFEVQGRERNGSPRTYCTPQIWDTGLVGGEYTGIADEADAAFIAAARTDVPALVAEVRRLRAELAMAGDELERTQAWLKQSEAKLPTVDERLLKCQEMMLKDSAEREATLVAEVRRLRAALGEIREGAGPAIAAAGLLLSRASKTMGDARDKAACVETVVALDRAARLLYDAEGKRE